MRLTRSGARRSRVRWTLGLFAGASGLVGCALVASLDDHGEAAADAGDASSDGASDAAEAAPAPCALDLPAPPAVADDAGATYHFAVRSFDFGYHGGDAGLDARPDVGAAPLGRDLDCVATCAGGGESCVPHADAGAHCDAPNGADQQTAMLLNTLAGVLSGVATDFDVDVHVARGEIGLLFQLTDWNGTPDDPRVLFSAFAAGGIWPDGGTAPSPPTWNGSDAWSVAAGTRPAIAVDAYVAGGVVVAHLAEIDVPISAGIGTAFYPVEEAVVTARLTRGDAGSYTLEEGRIVGRVPTRAILSSLATLRDPLGAPTAPLCSDPSTYAATREGLCALADISSHAAADGTGHVCDAVSGAAAFRAEPSAPPTSTHVPGVAQLSGCEQPDGAPFTDDCPP